jgi:hypothetical protein
MCWNERATIRGAYASCATVAPFQPLAAALLKLPLYLALMKLVASLGESA